MWLASQITEMFLYLFGRAWNENHIDFYSPFFRLPLICSKGDSDTVAAEGDLAAMAVLVPFQRMREDVNASEAARAEPSLSVSCCAVVLNTQRLLHFYIHSGALELLPCCFCLIVFWVFFFNIYIYFSSLFIYLAVPFLSYSLWAVVPWPGIEPRPPAWSMKS